MRSFSKIIQLETDSATYSNARSITEIRVKQDTSLFCLCNMEHTGIEQMLDICNGFLVVLDFLVKSFNFVGLYIHGILEAERLRNIFVDGQNADFAENVELVASPEFLNVLDFIVRGLSKGVGCTAAEVVKYMLSAVNKGAFHRAAVSMTHWKSV